MSHFYSKSQERSGLGEHALVLALVAVIVIAVLMSLGPIIFNIL